MEPLLSAADVAALLNVSRKCVYSLVHSGRLPAPVQVGNRSRWRQADVQAILDSPRRLRRPRRGGGSSR